MVADAVAQALGVKERPGRSISAILRDHLRARHLLVILDNFEHLVTAAPLVSELLAAAPGLTVLLTSRAPLTICGEQQFRLEPLRDADAAGARLTSNEADTAIYSDICRRLDRLPFSLSEKGFYGMAIVLSMFAAITVQKNTRDCALSDRTHARPSSLHEHTMDDLNG
jgi:predicted ATPase